MTLDQAKTAAFNAFENELKESFAAMVDMSRKLVADDSEKRIGDFVGHAVRTHGIIVAKLEETLK